METLWDGPMMETHGNKLNTRTSWPECFIAAHDRFERSECQ